MELSTQLEYASVHVLGYLVDPTNRGLVAETATIREERLDRAEAMVGRIGGDYALTWDDVLAQTTRGATVGRPHIADALVARGHRARPLGERSTASCTGAAATTSRTRRREPLDGVRLDRRGRRSAGDRASGHARAASG